jgi:hypothetical protein
LWGFFVFSHWQWPGSQAHRPCAPAAACTSLYLHVDCSTCMVGHFLHPIAFLSSCFVVRGRMVGRPWLSLGGRWFFFCLVLSVPSSTWIVFYLRGQFVGESASVSAPPVFVGCCLCSLLLASGRRGVSYVSSFLPGCWLVLHLKVCSMFFLSLVDSCFLSCLPRLIFCSLVHCLSR